jgi:hypothetical protein
MHGSGETIMLVVRCSRGHLRIDVYDTSRSLLGAGGPSGTENGPGLALVAALSTEWGSFRTPAGEAVYFTLAFLPDLPEGGDRAAQAIRVDTVSREPVWLARLAAHPGNDTNQ